MIHSRHTSPESRRVEHRIETIQVSNDKSIGPVKTVEAISLPSTLTQSARPVPSLSSVSSVVNLRNASDSGTQEQPEQEVKLQEDILNIIGPRLEADKQKAVALHRDVVIRWTEIFKQGLPKEEEKSLLKKYQIPENCVFIAAPELIAEVVSAVQDNVKLRDKRISEKQERIASCLAAVGKAISINLKTDSSVKLELLEILSDVGRLLAFLHREQSEIRKNLILANLDSSLKEVLKGSAIDGFLFGANLEEKVKTAKTLERTSKDLKPSNKPLRIRNSKNQKGPPAQRQSMFSRNPQLPSGLKRPMPSSSNSKPRTAYPRK